MVLIIISKKFLINLPKRYIEKITEKHDIQRTMNENMRKLAPFPPILGPTFKETTLSNGGDDPLQLFNLCCTDSVFKFLEMETNSKGRKTKHTKMPRSKGMLTCANEMKTFIALCDGNSDITIIT